MNSTKWLAILAIIFAGILLIKVFPQFMQAKKTETFVTSVDTTRILNESISLDSSKVDTAVSISQPAIQDTLWKAFRRKPQSKAWKAFFDIQYEHKGAYGYYPKFKPKHWQFHNQIIEVKGYMYPLNSDKKQTFFMLSFYPIQQCFFCGGAGPESIIEVNSSQGIRLSSQRIKVKGKLTLNTTIPERLFYILDEAAEVK